MDLSSKPLYGSFFWSFLEQGGAKFVQIIVQIVLARILAPEAFGLLAIMLVITSIMDSIAQSGFGMALIQKTDASDISYDTAFWLSMGIATLLYVALFVTAPYLASFYGMPALADSLRVLSLVVFFNSANSIQRSWMQKRMDFKGLFRISLIAVVCSGTIGIGAAFFGWGIWALVTQALAQSLFICVAMIFIVPWRPRFHFSKSEAAELYGYGWKICITGILNVFYIGVSELILGKACSAGELGFYSQGRKYPNAAIAVASNAMANVFFPAFADVKNDSARFRSRIERGLVLGTFAMAPISLLGAAIAEPAVAILLGEAWIPCVPIFALTCAANAIIMLQLVNLRAYMALGRSDLYMWLQVAKVALGVLVIGGTAFISHDVYATAWAAFFVGLICVIGIDMQPAARVHGYARSAQLYDVYPLLGAAAAAYIIAMCVTLFNQNYFIELLLQIVVYLVVYLAICKLFNFPALDEVMRLLGSFSGRGNK